MMYQEPDELMTIAKSHVAQLMEHFDTVQILCSKYDAETEMTHVFTPGSGNILARTRQCEEFVRNEDTKDKLRTIANQEATEEDDEDASEIDAP